jgi:hypothetical protein
MSFEVFRVVFFSIGQHRLVHMLRKDGVRFKDVIEPQSTPVSLVLQLMPLLLMTQEGPFEPLRECFRYYGEILERQKELAERERLIPLRQEIEARLLKIFPTDPFQKYQVLKSPPDAELT